MTLHDRLGEASLMNWDERELSERDNNIWARMEKRKISTKEKSKQIDLKQDYDSAQIGIDLIRKKKENRIYLFGIMGGYGSAKTNAKGNLYDAEGNIKGYSMGLYALFMMNTKIKMANT